MRWTLTVGLSWAREDTLSVAFGALVRRELRTSVFQTLATRIFIQYMGYIKYFSHKKKVTSISKVDVIGLIHMHPRQTSLPFRIRIRIIVFNKLLTFCFLRHSLAFRTYECVLTTFRPPYLFSLRLSWTMIGCGCEWGATLILFEMISRVRVSGRLPAQAVLWRPAWDGRLSGPAKVWYWPKQGIAQHGNRRNKIFEGKDDAIADTKQGWDFFF
jgi:hypothetical protein